MKKIFNLLLLLIIILGTISCNKTVPFAPEENELLDGPMEGLSIEQQLQFLNLGGNQLQRKIVDWDKATLNLAVRVDYVDWNVGTFTQTDTDIGDEQFSITPAISFRPTQQTVFRINYRYWWKTDILNNPAVNGASWLVWFSTYF